MTIDQLVNLGGIATLAIAVLGFVAKMLAASESRFVRLTERDQESREAMTKALTEMNTLLTRINGNIYKLLGL